MSVMTESPASTTETTAMVEQLPPQPENEGYGTGASLGLGLLFLVVALLVHSKWRWKFGPLMVAIVLGIIAFGGALPFGAPIGYLIGGFLMLKLSKPRPPQK